MSLLKEQKIDIENVLRTNLRKKFQSYKPEPASMPFHTRLLGKDRMALFSFIHSLNTNFGTSIFQPVAKELSNERFKRIETQAEAGTRISEDAQREIQRIMDSLITAKSLPAKSDEIERIRKVCQKGKIVNIKPTRVDILLEGKNDELFLFDIKTAKPNIGGFKEYKRTLLEWVATTLVDRPKAKVNTLIAIPYNPYEPQAYSRWTMRGILDLESELKVADEFWDFLGGKQTYKDLLDCFEKVGVELRNEIDEYFKKYIK